MLSDFGFDNFEKGQTDKWRGLRPRCSSVPSRTPVSVSRVLVADDICRPSSAGNVFFIVDLVSNYLQCTMAPVG